MVSLLFPGIQADFAPGKRRKCWNLESELRETVLVPAHCQKGQARGGQDLMRTGALREGRHDG